MSKNSTLQLAPALAYDVVEAFDGDDVHGNRVRSLAAVVSVSPLSTREMMTWVKLTTGTELSQKTVDRSLSVAKALVAAEYDFVGTESGVMAATAANLVRIRTASPKNGGGQDGMLAALGDWKNGDVVALCSTVAEYWETVQELRSLPLVEEPVAEASADTDDSGAGSDDTENAVGGGESSVMSAEKAATILREIAGNVSSGRMAPTDDLISAAQAILSAAADAFATIDAVTATANAGALSLA